MVRLDVRPARARIVVPTATVRLTVPSARAGLRVPRARAKLTVPAGDIRLFVGTQVVSLPHLISAQLGAIPGILRVFIEDSVWSDLGKIRYSAVRISDGWRSNASAYVPTTPATSWANAVIVGGLTAGVVYRLDYWLDCIPDVTGYTEGWVQTSTTWTHPGAGDPPIDEPVYPEGV